MAFVAGDIPPLVAYKTRIGRRYFWAKILNFSPDPAVAGAQHDFPSLAPAFRDPRHACHSHGADDIEMFFMMPFTVLMRSSAFLMARSMFLILKRVALMVLMVSVKSESGAVATGFLYGLRALSRRNPVATAPGSDLSADFLVCGGERGRQAGCSASRRV